MDQTAPSPATRTRPAAEHRQALHDAVQRYQRPLVAYARSLTGDLERAREAAQDTLLRLCQQPAETYQADIQPRLSAWLFTVCRNRVIDLHRKEQRMTPTDAQQLDQRRTARGPSPADAADTTDQQDHLLGLVQALPEHQREVVQLRFRGGLAYKDIAEVTGHSVSYVGVLLHEAIKQLRTDMTRLNA